MAESRRPTSKARSPSGARLSGSGAAAPSSTGPSRFTSLPDGVHGVIASYLTLEGRRRVSEVAASMLPAYGCRIRALRFSNAPYIAPWSAHDRSFDGMQGLLMRQEALEHLQICYSMLLPTLAPALAAGRGHHLRTLELGREEQGEFDYTLPMSSQAVESVMGLLKQPRLLAAVEELRIYWIWPSPVATCLQNLAPLLTGLAQGAWPSLRKLALRLPWDGSDESESDVSTAPIMEALVTALEARAALGRPSLTELDAGLDKWTACSTPELRRRFWTVLGPSAEVIPPFTKQQEKEVADAMVEHGTAALRSLEFFDAHLTRCLPQLGRLESLVLHAVTVPVADALRQAVAAAGGAQQFLPRLRTLKVTFVGAGSSQPFFEAIGRELAFPELRSLYVGCDDGDDVPSRELTAFLAAGTFPELESLMLRRMEIGGEQMELLIGALAHAPCAHTLRDLWLHPKGAPSGAAYETLGRAIGSRQFPRLTALHLGYKSHSADEAMRRFTAGLSLVAPPLEVLDLERMYLNDEGVKCVVKALETGGLGHCLKEIRLGHTAGAGCITNLSARALATAFKEGRNHALYLEELRLFSHYVTPEGVTTLLGAVATCCPRFRTLILHERVSRGRGKDVMYELASIKGISVDCRREQGEPLFQEDGEESEEEVYDVYSELSPDESGSEDVPMHDEGFGWF